MRKGHHPRHQNLTNGATGLRMCQSQCPRPPLAAMTNIAYVICRCCDPSYPMLSQLFIGFVVCSMYVPRNKDKVFNLDPLNACPFTELFRLPDNLRRHGEDCHRCRRKSYRKFHERKSPHGGALVHGGHGPELDCGSRPRIRRRRRPRNGNGVGWRRLFVQVEEVARGE